ncbi:hypothetical protein BDY24DRAFT_55291 [Mrakia frigida]|uniref:uncharacterized protein n=1 Tax=Mrakia frigida TaxID=29902 RepID=UPI003FCC12E1
MNTCSISFFFVSLRSILFVSFSFLEVCVRFSFVVLVGGCLGRAMRSPSPTLCLLSRVQTLLISPHQQNQREEEAAEETKKARAHACWQANPRSSVVFLSSSSFTFHSPSSLFHQTTTPPLLFLPSHPMSTLILYSSSCSPQQSEQAIAQTLSYLRSTETSEEELAVIVLSSVGLDVDVGVQEGEGKGSLEVELVLTEDKAGWLRRRQGQEKRETETETEGRTVVVCLVGGGGGGGEEEEGALMEACAELGIHHLSSNRSAKALKNTFFRLSYLAGKAPSPALILPLCDVLSVARSHHLPALPSSFVHPARNLRRSSDPASSHRRGRSGELGRQRFLEREGDPFP